MTALLLTAHEARVLAALVEKSITTPQYYPMTVNAVMLAANQKNSRNPVLSLSEGDTGSALNTLELQGLVARDDSSARASKWRQRMQNQLLLKAPTLALMATLMLRGPQTIAELRANAQALGGPEDSDGVFAALNDLADRAQPLVTQLARAPGQKEARYAQLLCGEVANSADMDSEAPTGLAPRAPTALEARVLALEEKLAALEARLLAAGG